MMKRLICSIIGCALIVAGIQKIAPKTDKQLYAAVVRLSDGKSGCTGVQVKTPSGKQVILTARHCMDIAENGGVAKDEAGKEHKVSPIASALIADLAIMSPIPGVEGLDIAKSVSDNQHIRIIGSGRALKPYMTEGRTIQEHTLRGAIGVVDSEMAYRACVSQANREIIMSMTEGLVCLEVDEVIMTTALVTEGVSGGPVLNDKGEVVGIAVIQAEYLSGVAKLKDIQELLKDK